MIQITFKDGISSINLKELKDTEYDDLPELIDSRNCVYVIKNTLNGKIYVGKTKYLYYRFLNTTFSHLVRYEYAETHLYNSMRKYGLSKFILFVLEKDLSEEELYNRELYWINYLQSYNSSKGYNMTTGGEGFEPCQTEDAVFKSGLTKVWNYVFSIIEELKSNNVEVTIESYLNLCLYYSNKNVSIIRRHILRLSYYLEAFNQYPEWTPYAKIFSVDLNEEVNKLYSKDSAEKAYATQVSLYGVAPMHSEESQAKAIVNRSLSRKLNRLQSNFKEFREGNYDISPKGYFDYCRDSYYSFSDILRHINSVLCDLESMKLDSRWEPLMSVVFDYFNLLENFDEFKLC